MVFITHHAEHALLTSSDKRLLVAGDWIIACVFRKLATWNPTDTRCLRDFLVVFELKQRNVVGDAPSSSSSSSSGYDHRVSATAYEDKMTGNCSDIQQENMGAGKQKRISRIAGGGLQQLSVIVCKKVESKGTTSFSEVADEIIAEFAAMHKDKTCLDEFDEKNIRRRVYDALNVFMALNIISKECKDKKREIQWKGLPSTKLKDIEKLEALHVKLMRSIAKKTAYLQELEEQIAGLQNLTLRNQKLHESGNIPPKGLSLPFLLVQTHRHTTVEIEISEDMQLVHFDFNSSSFVLHDDVYILKLMQQNQFPENRGVSQNFMPCPSSSSGGAGNSQGTINHPLEF